MKAVRKAAVMASAKKEAAAGASGAATKGKK
jgi:hypothetical protein